VKWLDALFGRSPVVAHAESDGPTFDITRDEIASSYFGLPTWDDYGGVVPRISRREAMSVPAVKRSRDLIAGTIGQLPLDLYDTSRVTLVSDLLTQPERHCARSISLTQLAEDMLFEQVGWWRVTERNFEGYPRFVRRISPERVQVDEVAGVVRVDGKIVPDRDLIRFDSPNDPLLVAGARAIRTCMLLDAAAARSAASPMPQGIFTPAEGADPTGIPEGDETQEEADIRTVQAMLAAWRTARQENADAYLPAALKYNAMSWDPEKLQLNEARQHAVLEIARVAGVDPEELGVSTTSRTYSNQFDRRKAFLDFTLGAYLTAIEQRLSLGDVTKRGRYVKFNLDSFLRSDTLTRYQAYKAGLEVDAITREEIREAEDKPALPARPVQEATVPTASQFSAEPEFLAFDAPADAAEFQVDLEKRTIRGLVVPFGKVAESKGRNWSFSKGTLKFDHVSRVKLLDGHDWKKPIGRATSIEETDAGMVATFSVVATPAGDEALLMASDLVKDGLSIGVAKGGTYNERGGVYFAVSVPLAHVALTPCPAFDDARVTAVAASKEGEPMTESQVNTPAEGSATPAPEFSDAQLEQLRAMFGPKPEGDPNGPEVIPAAAIGLSVTEELPYQFDRGGNFLPGEHNFSSDLHDMARAKDEYGNDTEAGRRVMGLIEATFATTSSTNVDELNPAIQRPDMYVDQRDYRTPLWNFVNKGTPPNGIQPFTFPKFSAAAGLVGDHTEGTEPTSGSYTSTNQTVTPTALSGKASVTREVWDMGGNPAVSTLIFNQMKRGWREGLETATATFLNTLTAATDITLTAGSGNDVLAAAWDAAVADLQFVRGYDFEALALEKELYKKFVAAVDLDGRKLFPQINPANANGTSSRRFTQLDLAGVTGVPSWALPSTAGSPNNSWLFDPMVVHGWASTPQRLEFPGTSATGTYAPVAMVDLAIWGYKAFANSDIGGVRQVIYDTIA
jgi:HK97 family phage portal protein/HK97 family phage prohead protease